MSRAKFQVLIIPFRILENGITKFAVAKRSDMDIWQFLSGGGEGDETPLKAAKREANEVDVKDKKLVLSSEHTEIKWLKYEDAVAILKFDSNKTALYELNERLLKT